jgi:hypothetical protein
MSHCLIWSLGSKLRAWKNGNLELPESEVRRMKMALYAESPASFSSIFPDEEPPKPIFKSKQPLPHRMKVWLGYALLLLVPSLVCWLSLYLSLPAH